jgi:hypothetical protein
MEPLIYVMAILGCGESDAACREVAVLDTRYRSEAACLAATEAALLRHDDVAYPSVVAQCRHANERPQLLRGSDVALPDGGAIPARRPRLAAAETAPRR